MALMTKTNATSANNIPPAHAKKGPFPWQWVYMGTAAVLAVALFVGVAGGLLYRDLSGQVAAATLDTSHLTAQSSEPQPEEEDPQDPFKGRAVNILLMGIDARAGQDKEVLATDNQDPTMRSDTTLMMHFSQDRENLTVVSIPRDMWIEIPECKRSDGSVSPAQQGQFNWAFAFGAVTDDMAAGVACTESTTEMLTGVQVDGFAVVDFTSFANLVEALGGVEVCLEEPVKDTRHLSLDLPAGCQVLDPVEATEYARVRYVGDGSDMGRIQRQQDLLGAMVMDALDSNMLTEVPKLYAFLSAAISSTRLSPSLSSLKTDAGLAASVKDIDPQNIRFVTMPVVTADFNHNRLLPKEPANQEFWQALIEDEPLPAGTVFMDIQGNYFTVLEDGEIEEGGNPRTDDEIGSLYGSTS